MKTTQYFLVIGLFFCIAIQACAQDDLQELREFNILWSYENISVAWKMDGKMQLHLNDGISNLDEGKIAEALNAFDEALKLDSTSLISLYYRSICYKLQERYSLAKNDLVRLLKLTNEIPQAQLELGKNLILLNELEEAENQLLKCIDKYPRLANAYYLMGDLCMERSQLEKAKKYFKECEKLDKMFAPAQVKIGLIELVRTKDPQVGLRYFKKAIEKDSTLKEALWYRALLNLRLQTKKSLVDINTLIRHNPTNFIFILYRGLIRTELKDFDGAWADLYKFITNAVIDQSKFHGKQTSIDKRIDVQNAGYYVIRHLYGLSEENQQLIKKTYCLMFAGQNQDALKAIQKTRDIANTPLYQFLLGVIHEHLQQHEEAWACYDKALKLDNNILDAHQKRGIYNTNVENWKAAELDFSEMIRLNPENKFGYKLRSVTYFQQRNYEKSIQDVQKVLAFDSSDCAARKTLGFSLVALGKYLSAFDEFDKCHYYEGLSLDIISRMHTEIKVLLATGDTVKVLVYLTRIINQRPVYETGVVLKTEILERQTKYHELNEFLDDRLRRIVKINSEEYVKFLEKKKKDVSEIVKKQDLSKKP